jgi:hypothetical protein
MRNSLAPPDPRRWEIDIYYHDFSPTGAWVTVPKDWKDLPEAERKRPRMRRVRCVSDGLGRCSFELLPLDLQSEKEEVFFFRCIVLVVEAQLCYVRVAFGFYPKK